MFHELIKNLRIEKRLTLRDFCQQLGIDPSNWSKVERGINPPPGDPEFLASLAKFFGLRGDERQEFLDAAAVSRQELPADLADDELFQRALPAFFRAARGHDLSEESLKAFAEEVRKLHRRDQP